MRTQAKYTYQVGDNTFESEGNIIEQEEAALKHFGLSRSEGTWNMLGLLMVWYSYDHLDAMGYDGD